MNPIFPILPPVGMQRDPRLAFARSLLAAGSSEQPPQHWAQGLGRAAQSMAGGYLYNQARQQQAPQTWQAAGAMSPDVATAAPLDISGSGWQPPFQRWSGLFGLGASAGGTPTGGVY